ncbi:MAG TPA: hypothetical protein VL361_29155 [Candidatus Limnocylindrales bacterium]|jgi:hypothetical protein|nr:hypothetical protein [Candidatus Limnocylindrales bacterium]
MSSDLQTDLGSNGLKRLLRDKGSHAYFTGCDWSTNADQARVFGDQIEAIHSCVEHDLTNVELVLRFETSGVDVFSTTIR